MEYLRIWTVGQTKQEIEHIILNFQWLYNTFFPAIYRLEKSVTDLLAVRIIVTLQMPPYYTIQSCL